MANGFGSASRALEGFQVGKQLGQGQAPFGEFVRLMTERAKSMGLNDLITKTLVKGRVEEAIRAETPRGKIEQRTAERLGIFDQGQRSTGPSGGGGGGSPFPTGAPRTEAVGAELGGRPSAFGGDDDIDPILVLTGQTETERGFTQTFGISPQQKGQQEVDIQAQKEAQKRLREVEEGFASTIQLFSQLTAQFKAKLLAQEQLTKDLPFGGQGGVIPGAIGTAAAALRVPGTAAIKTASTQRNETALSLNNILTGQNRVIKGVVNLILETLSGPLDTAESGAQLAEQSLGNAFRLLVARSRGLLTDEEGRPTALLKSLDADDPTDPAQVAAATERTRTFVNSVVLTPTQERAMKQLIDRVLAEPAARQATFPEPEFRVPGAGTPPGQPGIAPSFGLDPKLKAIKERLLNR